ncbi:MAG: hypothetical protein IPM36_01740 [Lewinellaceae bacterium]|nr:hypothetical protein [Lewinellaceae bacterium]
MKYPILLCLALSCIAPMRAQIIDSYTTNQATLSDPPGGATSVSTGGADILGARRDIAVSLHSGAGPVTAGVAGGALSFSVSATTPDSRGEAVITWDGDAAPTTLAPTGLGGVNLTSGGNNAFHLRVNSATAGVEITLEVYTDGANASRSTTILPAVGAATSFFFAYSSSFVPILGAGADFANVGAIVLTVRGTEKSCSIDLLEAVVANPAITATQTDALNPDNATPNAANPNDGIRYTVTVSNNGTGPATGTQLTVSPDALTDLVGGSFKTSPVAMPDNYACTGNVGITVLAGNGVKNNDFDDSPGTLSITAAAGATTQGGQYAIGTDGGFSYQPKAGFTGTDQFTYTLLDGNAVPGSPTSDIGTVTITVSNLIWFVDNSAPAGGDGRLTSAFNSLTEFNNSAGPSEGALVFIKHTGTNYGGGIVLKNKMTLLGSGHTGGANLADVLPFALPPFSNPLPAINGSRPVIYNISGNGIALAADNTIRGVEVGRCSAAKILGNNFGTLTIGNTTNPDVALNGNRWALSLTNGAFAGTSKFASINCPDSSGILLNTVSGSLASASTTVNAHLAGDITIDIQNSSAALDFGATTANNFSVGTVIRITNSGTGSVSFSNLSCTHAGNGPGLVANAGGTINIGGAGSTITARPALDITNTSFGAGATFASITANGNTKGVNLDNVSGALTINGGSITNSTSIAFDVNAGSGAVTYAGTINNAARAVEVTGRTGSTVTFSGNITNTGTGINVANNTGGTITFSGTSKNLNTGANAAVTLANNSGATINFTNGGLALTTTSGTGFNATGGGTVTVQGTGNTISSTTGTALNVSSTTIGASNLTFQSISANGGANGIVLNNTGASGGLTVTGVGTTAGSGGIIQNKTGNGATFTSAANISLKNMDFTNCASSDGPGPCGNSVDGNSGCNAAIYLSGVTNVTFDNLRTQNGQTGINGINVTNFDLLNSFIDNHGDEVNEDGVRFVNLLGTANIKGNTIEDSRQNNIFILNTVSTALTINVGGAGAGEPNTIRRAGKGIAAQGDDGIRLEGTNNANITAIISNNIFHTSNADHVQIGAENNSTWNVTISNNTMNTATTVLGGGISLSCAGNWDGLMNYAISGNQLTDCQGAAINVNVGTTTLNGGTGTYTGNVSNNVIAGDGPGILLTANGGGTLNAVLQQNQINRFDADYAIRVLARDGSPTINTTLTANSINTSSTTSPFNGLLVQAGGASGDAGTVCAKITNNSFAGSGGNLGSSDTDFRLRQRFNTTINLPGYAGLNTNTAAVVSFVQAQGNTGTGSATVDTNGFTGTGVNCN